MAIGLNTRMASINIPGMEDVKAYVGRQKTAHDGGRIPFNKPPAMEKLAHIVTAMEWVKRPPKGMDQSTQVGIIEKLENLAQVLNSGRGATRTHIAAGKIIDKISNSVRAARPQSDLDTSGAPSTIVREKAKTLTGDREMSAAERHRQRRTEQSKKQPVIFVRGKGGPNDMSPWDRMAAARAKSAKSAPSMGKTK